MLENEGRRLGGQILEDVQGIVHVGQVGLARMLARLEHVLLGQGRDQSLSRADELHAAHLQTSLGQLVERGRLVRVLAVAQPLGLAVDFPGALSENQFLVAQSQLEVGRKRILLQRRVHLLQITHGVTPCCSRVFLSP